ncbi:hypothetical protein C4565_04915 [Candidatus Parcubacteria bacterium]|nr:MAG: hypothetical protein C4565_04915 [Candidatus Parcubacteria bacterium]
MNTDIRVLTSFRGHRKRKRLELMLGLGGTGFLIDLWLTAAEDRPDGILHGWDDLDIALACGYSAGAQKLVDALVECRWLDKGDDGTYRLHDWDDHQGWCLGSEYRSTKARINALIKHFGREKGLKRAAEKFGINPADFGYKDAVSMLPADEQHATQDAPSPSPSPSPSPKPNTSQTLYEFYVSEIEPGRKSSKRAQGNIKKHLRKHSFEDLRKSVLNYKSTLNGTAPQYRKDPANFFGQQELYFMDFLPENFKSTQPEASNPRTREITPENIGRLYEN